MIPVTYRYHRMPEAAEERRAFLKGLAEGGIRRLVLSYRMLDQLMNDPALLLVWRDEVREFGLRFMDAHAQWGEGKNPATAHETLREQAVLRHRIAIRFCHELGITSLTFHPGGGPDLNAARTALLRTMEELLPDAGKYGVTLCLENVWTPLDHSSVLLDVMRRFDSPRLGLCYDTGHANLTEQGKFFPEKSIVPPNWTRHGLPVTWEEDLIEKFAPWLVNCHFHDNHGVTDEHGLPGSGTVDWARIMRVLKTAPRLQCVQSEVKIPENGIDPLMLRDTFRKISPELDV